MMNKIMMLILVVGMSASSVNATETNLLSIPVLTERIKKGTILKANHLAPKQMDIRRVARTILKNKESIVGLEATRNISHGSPIYQGYVRVSPDVHRNSSVTIAYNVGGIKLSAKGKAMEDGNIGTNISIMNTVSKKLIFGTVVAKNKVIVE